MEMIKISGLYNQNLKRIKEIKYLINSRLKIVNYSFKGIRTLFKKISIQQLYELSNELGKLDIASYKFFSMDNLNTKNIDKKEMNIYISELNKLKSIIEKMKSMKEICKKEIEKCQIGKGSIMYKEDIDKIKNFSKSLKDMKEILDNGSLKKIAKNI